MPGLNEIQQLFAGAVVRKGPLAEGLILGPPSFPPLRRVEVYANGYMARLANVLADQYRRTLRAMGGSEFDLIAVNYTNDNPSTSWTLSDFGSRFPEYIAESPCIVDRPYLPDLARAERAMHEVFDESNSVVLDANSLSSIAPEAWPDLTFKPATAFRRLKLDWDIEPMLDAMENEQEAPAPLQGATTLVVWRKRFRVLRWTVPKEQDKALGNLLDGNPFREVCDSYGMDDAARLAADLLKTLVDGEMLTARTGSAVRS